MRKIWSRIVIWVLFGTLYYAADKILSGVENTLDLAVATNVRVTKKHIDTSWLSGALLQTGIEHPLSWDTLSLSKNISWVDNWSLDTY